MTTKYAGKVQDRRYEGDAVDITYSVKRCIHAAHCVNRLAEVFDTKKRPWINANDAEGDKVAEVVGMCPSGALHYERKDGGIEEAIPTENTITVRDDGELIFKGNLSIQGTEVDVQQETRATLCRCGASNNKPFCDNSHKEIGFTAGTPTATNKQDDSEQSGQLVISAHPQGPLEVAGNFRMQDEAGNTLMTGDKTWLCRCGGSAKKPFCDGTHKQNGFDGA
jgi:CDGSH-type Zn-finger protein/uncharacterized Fe-S cluster protein YjdI